MRKHAIVGLIVGCAIATIVGLGHIPIWRDDAKARENRRHVHDLIVVGENLKEAEQTLREAGFRLVHDEPIAPTVNRDYLQQIVVVGETQPNVFESFAYAAGWQWMPFVRSESPYVVINSTLTGKITKIE